MVFSKATDTGSCAACVSASFMGGKSFVQAGDWDGHGAFGLHRLCCVRNRLWYNSAMKQGEENGSGERARAVDRYLHTGSFEAFRSTFLSGLVLAFFGIGFYRLWYQFNFYNLHFSADVGMVTVGANVARVVVIALLVLLVYKAGFTRATRGVFVWSGFVLMTVSSLLYLLDSRRYASSSEE